MAAADRLRLRRVRAQLLDAPRPRTPEGIVRHLLAVQAQDLRSARLALRARGDGLLARDVDEALNRRELVVGWLSRGTLHLVRPDDYAWLLGLTAPSRMATSRRRLGQGGVPPGDADRAVREIERALADEGPLSRANLAERVAALGVRTEGQATPHLLMLAALRGAIVLGPTSEDGQLYALAEDWLGTRPTPLDGPARERALGELARRYLAGHGPATPADLAAWSGLPLRNVRAGLAVAGSSLGECAELAGTEWAGALEPREPAAAATGSDELPLRLLPAFDPYLLGWKDRSPVVAAEHARLVHPGGGMLRAVALVDGRAVATWTARRTGTSLKVELAPFAELSGEVIAVLRAEAADVARFEGRVLS